MIFALGILLHENYFRSISMIFALGILLLFHICGDKDFFFSKVLLSNGMISVRDFIRVGFPFVSFIGDSEDVTESSPLLSGVPCLDLCASNRSCASRAASSKPNLSSSSVKRWQNFVLLDQSSLKDKLNMEKAGSPVTFGPMFKKFGSRVSRSS